MIAFLTLIDDFDPDRVRMNWVYLLSLGHPYAVKDSFLLVLPQAGPCKDVAIIDFVLYFSM